MPRKGLRTFRIFYHFRVLKKRWDRLGLGPGARTERAGSIGWVAPWPRGSKHVSDRGGGGYFPRPRHEEISTLWFQAGRSGPRALEAPGSYGTPCFKERKCFRIFFFSLLFLIFCGCNYARMYDQESVRTYETPLPEMPEGTIPIHGGTDPLKMADAKGLRNPLPRNPDSLEQGKGAYKYFCIQCHGPVGDGNGTVGQSFAPLPANLKEKAVQRQTDGELFVKISLGYRRHPPLASTVSAEDRWAVVHFIRGLETAK